MRPAKERKARPSAPRRNTSRYVLGPGGHPPIAQLRLISARRWERFVEDCCVTQTGAGLKYEKVKRLGGPGDRGRDVEALMSLPRTKHNWDLYQCKHYKDPLAKAQFYPELAKFFLQIAKGAYPEPAHYFLCAPQDCGVELHDLLMGPIKFKLDFLNEWQAGGTGLKSLQTKLNAKVEVAVNAFDFKRIRELQARNLLRLHEQNPIAHFKLFGIVPRREADPTMPPGPAAEEQQYIQALIDAYSEASGAAVDPARLAGTRYDEHFNACRSQFYSAEGLKRFSRDVFPGEFANLLDSVFNGVRPIWASPRLKTGIERLDAVITHVSTLKVNDSPLNASLRPPDLPGTCQHLANDGKLKWVR